MPPRQSPRSAAWLNLHGDLREPDRILRDAAATIDFSRPVAIMLMAILQMAILQMAILQYIPDAGDPCGIVSRLLAAVPSGSYLVISHPARDVGAEDYWPTAWRLRRTSA
jgi:hypothetical protein